MENEREVEYQALRSFVKAMDNADGVITKKMAIAINEELTDRQREMVNMYYIQQMTMAQIADELGVSVSTVSRTLQRGRNRLRRCLRYGGQNLLSSALDL